MAAIPGRRAQGANAWVDHLRQPPMITSLNAVAARFIYSVRLVALYRHAKRDPAPELAARLGSFPVAIKSLQLIETIGQTWPEAVSVQRFCCRCLSHDEATIGAMVQACARHDFDGYSAQLAGLIRKGGIAALWGETVELITAELTCAAGANAKL